MRRLVYFFMCLVILGLGVSCQDDKQSVLKSLSAADNDTVEKKDSVHFDKYLYKDSCGILHSDLKCIVMYDILAPREGVERIFQKDLKLEDVKTCCRHCISNDAYDSLRVIIRQYWTTDGKHVIPGFGSDNK